VSVPGLPILPLKKMQQSAHATTGQAQMTAYLISQVEILDPNAWAEYRTRAGKLLREAGGRFLVRGAMAEVIESDWPAEEPPPQSVIVLAFPDMETLHAWYESPAYAEALAFRTTGARRRMIFVEGYDDPDG
jgi:uncharacterized protein (DUF1330 family)